VISAWPYDTEGRTKLKTTSKHCDREYFGKRNELKYVTEENYTDLKINFIRYF
jgi:hypothetical protein